ncbi:MAG: DUF3306 domain-containing protein [Paracoccaceae bacterium]
MSRPNDFWSRRKAGVQAEAEAEVKTLEAEAVETEQAEKTDDELLAELDLPNPDDMQPGDDFTVFMKSAVPDRLRRRALRKLWLTNPVLANVDGLVDYGEDFTDAAMVIENMQTAYQVGKGMTKHVLEMARQEAEKEAAENAPDEVPEEIEETLEETDDTPELTDEPTEEPEAIEVPEPLIALTENVETTEPEEEPTLPPRRRMQFAYAE